MKRLSAILCIALLAGCSQQQVDSAGSAISSSAPVAVNDALIVAQIEGTFLSIDADSALHTAVSSHAGVVALSGKVKSAEIRDEFIARAKTTHDVKGVASTLAIDPRLPSARAQASDFGVTVAVETSLAAQAGINALRVHVESHAGAVTLSGEVDTPALHATMLETAKKTAGVRSVRDELKVKS